MKKNDGYRKITLIVLMVVMMLFTGCGGFKYSFTMVGDNTKIEVNAKDGDYAESSYFSVGRNSQITVEPQLDKGSMKIEFAEATVFMTDSDSSNDVIIGNVVTTVTVKDKEKAVVTLPEGDYVLLVTAIGSTKGTVEIKVNNN